MKDMKNSLLIDVFQKSYSHFDEDDVELWNDLLHLLDELKVRGCVTEDEYIRIKITFSTTDTLEFV